MDNYFNRAEVSNSDLSWLNKYWMPQDQIIDYEKAYKFGTLIDAMITEPHRINYFKRTVDKYQYTEEDFARAEEMKKSFMADALCMNIFNQSVFQRVSVNNDAVMNYEGIPFKVNKRCKWDLYMPHVGWGGDIKSTTATTQKQFEEAIRYFDYDRQRAWYMDIDKTPQDILIGISKVNFKVFKVPIPRARDRKSVV